MVDVSNITGPASTGGLPSAQRSICKVLVTVRFPQPEMDRLRRAFAPAELIQCDADDDAAVGRALDLVDVAVHANELDARFLSAPRLKWVHCDHAGLNRIATRDAIENGPIITGSAGRSATALAHHAFYFALALTYDAERLLANQRSHRWRGIPGYGDKQGLPGKTLGIVGLGNTGFEMARLGRAFGMRVLAYTRGIPTEERFSAVDELLCAERGEGLRPLLETSDVVMLAAPLTDATWQMISIEQLAWMKRSSLLINMARGGLIDEAALLAALEEGRIAGAGLDVFTTEPLPPDSPLWDAPNTLITPHVTPAQPDKISRSVDVIVANVDAYREGRPLANRLTTKDAFTPLFGGS